MSVEEARTDVREANDEGMGASGGSDAARRSGQPAPTRPRPHGPTRAQRRASLQETSGFPGSSRQPDCRASQGSPRDGLLSRLVRLAYANRRLTIVAVCAVVFVALLEGVLEGELMRLDAAAYQIIVEGIRVDWLTPFMEGLSALATPVCLVVMLLVIVAFAPGRRPGLCCALNLVLVACLNVVLKLIVQRPRPEGFRLAEVDGFSFPSGHSMVAMAFFGLIVWLVWHYERTRSTRWLLCVAFSLVAVMVGVSRVYLGVHYASDVVAGFCVSLAWLAVYTRLAVPLFLGEGRARGDAVASEGGRR